MVIACDHVFRHAAARDSRYMIQRTRGAPSSQAWAKPESAAFNHAPSSDIERQYDSLREKAHEEDKLQKQNVEKSKNAYAQGDGAGAKRFSEAAKQHAANEARFHRQARDLIFRENNSHLPGDTIDLHGLYVSEVEEVLTTRIRAGQQRNESHLHGEQLALLFSKDCVT